MKRLAWSMAFAAVAGPVAGCSGPHRAPATGVGHRAGVSPTPTMEIPETEPEVRTLKLVEPRVGGMAFEVEARKGGLVIAVTCLGAGTMKVGIAPVGSFDLPCDADKVSHNVNQMDLDKAEKLTFSVDAMPSVTWAVRVQQ